MTQWISDIESCRCFPSNQSSSHSLPSPSSLLFQSVYLRLIDRSIDRHQICFVDLDLLIKYKSWSNRIKDGKQKYTENTTNTHHELLRKCWLLPMFVVVESTATTSKSSTATATATATIASRTSTSQPYHASGPIAVGKAHHRFGSYFLSFRVKCDDDDVQPQQQQPWFTRPSLFTPSIARHHRRRLGVDRFERFRRFLRKIKRTGFTDPAPSFLWTWKQDHN